jgi:hypothetical protein
MVQRDIPIIRIEPHVFALAASGDPEQLKLALQHAVELEHATMPPYLYAWFSLGNQNPRIAKILKAIVREEMLHMTLAGNILKAIGGSPRIAFKEFVPTYPGPLPGTVAQDLEVPLKPFSLQLVEQKFMRIEQPEHLLEFKIRTLESAEEPAKTIGEFYRRIRKTFVDEGDKIIVDTAGTLQPNTDRFAVDQRVRSAKEAIAAIDLIVEQGEGTETDPHFPDGDDLPDNDPLAHYFRFAELVRGRLKRNPDATPETPPEQRYFYDSADRIDFDPSLVLPLPDNPVPGLYPAGSPAAAGNLAVNRLYTKVLKQLHQAFNGAPDELEEAVGTMQDMRTAALQLGELPIDGGLRAGPTFTYVEE